MAKGSVRKKGKKWYYRFYVEDASGNLVQKEFTGTESKSETEKLLRQAMEDYEEKKFGAAAEDVCADFTRAERILAFNGPMMQFCIYAVMVFVLSFCSYTIITSQGLDLDVGQ